MLPTSQAVDGVNNQPIRRARARRIKAARKALSSVGKFSCHALNGIDSWKLNKKPSVYAFLLGEGSLKWRL